MKAKDHLERLVAMRDDDGLTWDLSGNDRAAFAWAIKRIAELEKERDQWQESSGQNYVRAQDAEGREERLREALEAIADEEYHTHCQVIARTALDAK